MAELSDSSVDLSDYAEGMLAPVPGSEPAGKDVQYDDDFQRLKAEIDSMSSASGGSVDFEEVAALAEKILAGKSKDLRVACYLTVALERTRGASGLADGLAVVEGITTGFWEALYPPARRMTGRQNALQSLSDNLKERVAGLKPVLEDREVLEAALARTRALQVFTMEKMEEQAPALSGLSQAIEEVLRRVPKPAAPAAAKDTNGTPGAPAVAGGGTQAASASGEMTAATALQAARRAAEFFFAKSDADPRAYRLARAIAWGHFAQEPPVQNGKTMIEGPVAQRGAFLSGLVSQGQFARLVTEAESSLAEYPLWLDLQRFSVQGLDALGADHHAARDAVLYDTAVLVRRLPGLADLAFADGMSFADAATHAWLETDVNVILGSGDSGGAVAGGAGDAALDEAYADARALLGKGDVAGAVARMRRDSATDEGRLSGFRRQLYVATLCVAGGRADVALPLLERLDAEVSARRIDEWDPALALEVWIQLYRSCRPSGDADAGEKERMNARAGAVFEKICALDTARGLALASAPR